MIKQKWLFVVSIVIGVAAAIWAIERLMFVTRAERATGTVWNVRAENGRCGGRRSRHPCTRYKADVRYQVVEASLNVSVSAGRHRGHDQPIHLARYRNGYPVPLLYSPSNPGRVYRDEVADVWGGPLIALFAHIATLLGSFAERREPDDDA